MVVRVPGLYQEGFGGHFYNDNSVGALRDIPGVILAVPSRPEDAARMLRGCIGIALDGMRIFLEPIALYHERDLHADGDGGWLADYPPLPAVLLPGEVGMAGTGRTCSSSAMRTVCACPPGPGHPRAEHGLPPGSWTSAG